MLKESKKEVGQAPTPGPWIVKREIWLGGTTHIEGPGIFSIEDVATEMVICDRRTLWPEQVAVMEANARQIAATPDLVEALQAVHIDAVHLSGNEFAISRATVDKVAAALSEALGQSGGTK